jgi:hypothetical protein
MFGNQSERARGNRMLPRSCNRQRTTAATTDSLMFAGDVTTDDMNRIPGCKTNQRERYAVKL